MALYLIFGMIAIVVGALFVYVALMVFFPEWVGITGKTALNYEKSHHEDSQVSPDDDLVDRMQKKP